MRLFKSEAGVAVLAAIFIGLFSLLAGIVGGRTVKVKSDKSGDTYKTAEAVK